MDFIAGNHSITVAYLPLFHHLLRTPAFSLSQVLYYKLSLSLPPHAQSALPVSLGGEHIGEAFVVELHEGTFKYG